MSCGSAAGVASSVLRMRRSLVAVSHAASSPPWAAPRSFATLRRKAAARCSTFWGGTWPARGTTRKLTGFVISSSTPSTSVPSVTE